ncbi:peptidyl-prolyl cis-trans isomerase [Bacillus timonensis]|nr:peptidyl-prolyl cis-trans isomerase [Bacillus timonensis]
MNSKVLWSIIIALSITNCLTVAYFAANSDENAEGVTSMVNDSKTSIDSEVVATIGDSQISRQEWLSEMEARYGKQTLEDLVDQEVIKQMAKKYDINVSPKVIDREVLLLKTMYSSIEHETIEDENRWREQIEFSIILEELITKDVNIPESELMNYYKENQDLYSISENYHLSHIVVKTVEEANQIRTELKSGSSFLALAMESSIDEFTSNHGGELGFVSKDSIYIPSQYFEVADQLKPNQWSEPIKVEDGYAIILLHEKVEEIHFSFDEVKSQIRRQIAIEQMKGSVSVDSLWKEAKVKWFYGNE